MKSEALLPPRLDADTSANASAKTSPAIDFLRNLPHTPPPNMQKIRICGPGKAMTTKRTSPFGPF